jgi:hypothetical protein
MRYFALALLAAGMYFFSTSAPALAGSVSWERTGEYVCTLSSKNGNISMGMPRNIPNGVAAAITHEDNGRVTQYEAAVTTQKTSWREMKLKRAVSLRSGEFFVTCTSASVLGGYVCKPERRTKNGISRQCTMCGIKDGTNKQCYTVNESLRRL